MFPQLNCHSLGLCIYGEIRDTLLKVLQIIGNIIYTSLSFRRDIENLLSNFFSIRLFFSQTLTIYRTAGEEKIDYFLFHCTTSSRSQTFRYLFATLRVRWQSHIFNSNACIYQTANDIYHLIELPFDWLIDNAMFVSLLDDLILGFCYSNVLQETGGFELTMTITLVNQLTKCANHLEQDFLPQTRL